MPVCIYKWVPFASATAGARGRGGNLVLYRGLSQVSAVFSVVWMLSLVPHTALAECTHPTDDAVLEPIGDVTGSGTVTVADAVCAVLVSLWELAGATPGSEPGCAVSVTAADVDCSLTPDISDALFVVQLALGVTSPDGLDLDGTGCPLACCAAGDTDPLCFSCNDGDPCTTDTELAGGECEHEFTCVTHATSNIVFSGDPVIDDTGIVYLGGRDYPVNDGAGFFSPNRVHKNYALDSADLSIVWGPIALSQSPDPNCNKNNSSRVNEPALSPDTNLVYTHGDWNDGQIGDVCASVFARSAANGALTWRSQSGGPHPRHSMALNSTHIYWGGYNGQFRGFDLSTGAVDYTFSLGGSIPGSAPGGSVTFGDDGHLYVSTLKKGIGSFTATGSPRWSGQPITTIRGDITLTAGNRLIGWDSETGYTDMRVASAVDGSLLWTAPIPGPAIALTDADTHIYVAYANGVDSYDSSGTLRWSVPLTEAGKSQFLGDDGRFYVRTPTRLYALETSDGSTAWSFEVDDIQVSVNGSTVDNTFSASASLLAGGDIFITDHAGGLYRLDAALDYADAPWPRVRGNRRHTGVIDAYDPLP